jgi:hypothetical protein
MDNRKIHKTKKEKEQTKQITAVTKKIRGTKITQTRIPTNRQIKETAKIQEITTRTTTMEVSTKHKSAYSHQERWQHTHLQYHGDQNTNQDKTESYNQNVNERDGPQNTTNNISSHKLSIVTSTKRYKQH